MQSPNNGRMFPRSSDQCVQAHFLVERLVEISRSRTKTLQGALHDVSGKTGLSHGTLEKMRKEPHRNVLQKTFDRLLRAYVVECARQKALFEQELKSTRGIYGASHDVQLEPHGLDRQARHVVEQGRQERSRDR